MSDVAVILLAAGLSRRMGEQNKLLLPINGIPMIRHVAMEYRKATDGPITVVTGHDASLIEAALAGIGVTCVTNPNYASGQQSSVAFGLKHCPKADVVLIGLGDQPVLGAADILSLLYAHHAGDGSKVSVPMYRGARGNPIVVPRGLRPRLTADPDRPGCMRFTRENPDLVQLIALDADGFYTDVDTPAAYANLRQQEENKT